MIGARSITSVTTEQFPLQDEDKFVFIRKIEVLLNGTPLDQVEDKQNEDECIQAYWRMFAFNGQINSLFTNGISNIKCRWKFAVKKHC